MKMNKIWFDVGKILFCLMIFAFISTSFDKEIFDIIGIIIILLNFIYALVFLIYKLLKKTK